jgi:hypothetical protein
VLVTVEDGCVKEIEKCPLDVLRWVNCTVDLTDSSDMREVLELARISISRERESADGRPIAMRVRFQGASVISNELYAYPERFEQSIKALGAETAGDDLWIERVEIATVSKLDLKVILGEGGAFGKLLEDILATPANPDGIAGLEDALSDIRQRIPAEAFEDDSLVNLDEPQTIERLVSEAKQLLLGRLLTVEDAK